jgi:hypothetical protein
MTQPPLSAEKLAELLGTRVLTPEQYAKLVESLGQTAPVLVPVSPMAMASLSAQPEQVQTFLASVQADRQVVAGVLPADDRHPVRIVTRQRRQPVKTSHKLYKDRDPNEPPLGSCTTDEERDARRRRLYQRNPNRRGNEPPPPPELKLTPEDEAALDRVWEWLRAHGWPAQN